MLRFNWLLLVPVVEQHTMLDQNARRDHTTRAFKLHVAKCATAQSPCPAGSSCALLLHTLADLLQDQ